MCLSYLFRFQSSAQLSQLPIKLACLCETRDCTGSLIKVSKEDGLYCN